MKFLYSFQRKLHTLFLFVYPPYPQHANTEPTPYKPNQPSLSQLTEEVPLCNAIHAHVINGSAHAYAALAPSKFHAGFFLFFVYNLLPYAMFYPEILHTLKKHSF